MADTADTRYPRSPTVLLGGMAHLARLIDKVRLRHAGGIPDYTYFTGGFDKALVEFLQLDVAAFEQRVLAGGSDEEILAWVRTQGRSVSEAERRLWTRNVLASKPGDPEAQAKYLSRLREIAAKRGVSVDALPPVTTWVEAIDLDEGRL